MIRAETIERIWKSQREITVGEALLADMRKIAESLTRDGVAERIKDAFGRECDLQLGVPCGGGATRLLSVSPVLAVSIITAHIANKRAELVEANESARIELEARAPEQCGSTAGIGQQSQ
jgi:hypothetical protein